MKLEPTGFGFPLYEPFVERRRPGEVAERRAPLFGCGAFWIYRDAIRRFAPMNFGPQYESLRLLTITP
jgi:hypothetical protein